MEATGIYWIPLYDILEEKGMEVCLVNARHLKNVTGRKSDVSDCEWLYQLHTYGLLRGSFHPPSEIRALRALARHREMLVRYRDPKCKHSEAEIAKALSGHYRREHLFALQQAVELYDLYGQQMAAVVRELEAMYALMQAADEEDEPPRTTPPDPRRRKRRKNQAHFDLAAALYQMTGVDLTQIDGIDALTAQTLLTEIGLDMSKWPTAKHFASWLGLCPNNRITGGKIKRRRTKKTDSRAAAALRVAAQSLPGLTVLWAPSTVA